MEHTAGFQDLSLMQGVLVHGLWRLDVHGSRTPRIANAES